MSNTHKSASSLTGAISDELNKFLIISEDNAEDRVNTDVDSKKLIRCLKSILTRVGEFSFRCYSIIDQLKDAKNRKRLIDKHEAFFIAYDLACELEEHTNNLSLFTIRNSGDKFVRNSLSGVIVDEAIETLIELKNKGKI